MTQPTPYVKSQTFANIQSNNTLVPIPGANFDTEFFLVQQTLAQTLANLARIQRDDTALANSSVGIDQLKAEVVLLLKGITPKGNWLTTTLYAVGDVVTQASKVYACLVAHTSGTFATDLAANKWMGLSPFTGASSIGFTPTGGVSSTDVQAAIGELDSEKQPIKAGLASIGALVTAADKMIYTTAPDTYAVADLTAAARTLLAQTSAVNMLTNLGGVAKNGDTMTGLLILSDDPGAAKGAATKQYVDARNAPGPSFKNRIVNGDFYVDQRKEGGVYTITAGAAVVYTLDRWYMGCTGANVTVQRVAGTGSEQWALRITGLAANATTQLGQKIEGDMVADMTSQTATVSLSVKSTSIVSLQWNAYTADVKDNFAAKTQVGTGNITISSTLANYNFSFAPGLNAANGIAIEFTTGPLLAGQTITYQSMQVENSTAASAFERLSVTERLTRCERFYEKTYSIGLAPGDLARGGAWGGWASAGGVAIILGSFRVPKRVAPSMTVYATQSGTSGSMRDITGAVDRAASLIFAGTKSAELSNAATTASGYHEMHMTAEAEL